VPHGRNSHLVGERDLVDVISTCCEQDATRSWHRRTSIQAADVWSVADDVERRGHFADEQIRGGWSIPPPPVVDLADLRVSFRCGC